MTSPEPHSRDLQIVDQRSERGSWVFQSCKSVGRDRVNNVTIDPRKVFGLECAGVSALGLAPAPGRGPRQRVDRSFGARPARPPATQCVRSGRFQPHAPLASVSVIGFLPAGQVCVGPALVAIGVGPIAHVTRDRSRWGQEPDTGGDGE